MNATAGVSAGQRWSLNNGASSGLVNAIAEPLVLLTLKNGHRIRLHLDEFLDPLSRHVLLDSLVRDPRVDPRPGDVLRNPAGQEFHVLDLRDGDVVYQESGARELLYHPADQWIADSSQDQIVVVEI